MSEEWTFKQKLLGDMVAVRPQAEKSLVRLPDWQRTLKGYIVAVGPGAPLPGGKVKPMLCQVGDYVVFGAATGMDSSYCGANIRIMRDSDVDAVICQEGAA